jgi:acyl-CoA thioesterase
VSTPDAVARVIWREDEASRALGMTLEDVAHGRATLSMTVQTHMANGQKLCHGGYIFTLADSAFGYACNTHNRRAVSAGASIQHLAPAYVGERLTANAVEVERRGRRGVYDVKVLNQNGETVALFRGESATIQGTWL